MREEMVSVASECVVALHKAGIPAMSSGCKLEADVLNADRRRANDIVKRALARRPGYGADCAESEIEAKNEWILHWVLRECR